MVKRFARDGISMAQHGYQRVYQDLGKHPRARDRSKSGSYLRDGPESRMCGDIDIQTQQVVVTLRTEDGRSAT
jgi:hypothetical protein